MAALIQYPVQFLSFFGIPNTGTTLVFTHNDKIQLVVIILCFCQHPEQRWVCHPTWTLVTVCSNCSATSTATQTSRPIPNKTKCESKSGPIWLRFPSRLLYDSLFHPPISFIQIKSVFQEVICEDDADLKDNVEESISRLKLAMKDAFTNQTNEEKLPDLDENVVSVPV